MVARRRRWGRRWLVAAVVIVALLAVPAYSYTTSMLQPSSLPLGVRSVEWLRQHHGNWLVDQAESLYYGWWKAPKKGGPQLTSLPQVGLRATAAARKPPARGQVPGPAQAGLATAAAGRKPPARTPEKTHVRVEAWPPRIKPVFARPLPGEGVWKSSGPPVDGAPPVLVTTFRTELEYPRVVAYVAWFDHTRTALAFYPGRYEPPKAPVRGPMSVPSDQRWRLLATFNAGFIYSDGNNGSSINGISYEPLKDGLATLIGYRDGRVAIRAWTGGTNAGPGIAFTRQSLPLIIRQRAAEPRTQRQLAVGLHARKRRTCLAYRGRASTVAGT